MELPTRRIVAAVVIVSLTVPGLTGLAAAGGPGTAQAAEPADRPALPDEVARSADIVVGEDRRATTRPASADRIVDTVLEGGEPTARDLVTIQRRLATEVAGLPNVSLPIDPSAEADFHGLQGTLRFAIPAGDLTGDGRADVLSYQYNYSTSTLAVVAVDQDGATLWERTFDPGDVYYAFPYPAGDLTGDGADDVLLLTLSVDFGPAFSDCRDAVVVFECVGAGIVSYSWGLETLSGPTGDVAWSRSIDGRLASGLGYASAYDGVAYAAADAIAYEATNVAILFDVAEDAHGRHVVLDTLDATLLYGDAFALAPYYAFAYGSQDLELFRTRYEVIDGRTGRARHEGEIGPRTAPPFALAAGDLTGDGVLDLFRIEPADRETPLACVSAVVSRCVQEEQELLEVAAEDGADGSEIWRTGPLTPDGFPIVLAESDHTGDGLRDVVVWGWGWSEQDLTVLSGADGSTAWNRTVDGLFVDGDLGDADGDGGDDLLVIDLIGGFFDLEGIGLHALSGDDGSTIYDVVPSTPVEDPFYLLLTDLGDLDADGVRDLAVTGLAWDWWTQRYVSGAAAVSGADGAAEWSRTADGIEIPLGAGPLDGAPGDDALLYGVDDDCGEGFVFEAVNGQDPTTALWNRSARLVDVAGLWPVPASGTIDDHPARDLYLNGYTLDPGDWRLRSKIEAVTGHDGRSAWRVGEALARPDCTLDQDDAGSGGDAGDSPSKALSLSEGSHTGDLAPDRGDDADWYALNLSAGDRLNASLNRSDLDLCLWNATGHRLDCDWGGGFVVSSGASTSSHADDEDGISVQIPADGTYYLEVDEYDAASYALDVAVNDPPNGSGSTQDDAGSGGDAGDELASALPIEPGSYDGTLLPDEGDDEDWYGFAAASGDRISANVTPADADLDVELVAPDGSVLDASTRNGSAAEHVEAVADVDGTHHLRVVAADGSGNYTFDLQVAAGPRTETLRFEGKIGCTLVTPVLTSGDPCWVRPVGGPDRFEVGIDARPSRVRTTVAWDETTLGADRMAFRYPLTDGLSGAEGPSPVVHVQEVPDDVGWWDDGTTAWLDVDATAGTVAVVDQPFEVCVTVAYGDASLGPDPCR